MKRLILVALLLIAACPRSQTTTTASCPNGELMCVGKPILITVEPSPSPAPTTTASPTPAPTPTPPAGACTGTTYYVSNQGQDSATGTSPEKAWQTLAQVEKAEGSLQPGNCVLLQAGGTWNEQLDINNVVGSASQPITFAAYGDGVAPVLDEKGQHDYCIDALNTKAKYLTLNGWTCQHATLAGVTFQTGGGKMPGITVENFTIQDTGPGCYNKTGACLGNDPGGYHNQLDFQDFQQGADGVQFINNIVKWCGGHNCLQVHFDTGAVLIKGNIVGPGCVHTCLDAKGIGSKATHAVVTGNISGCGDLCSQNSAGFYSENVYNAPGSYIDLSNNTWSGPVGVQFCGGGCTKGSDCPIHATITNDTYNGPGNYALYAKGNCMSPAATLTITESGNSWDGASVIKP